MIEQSFKEVDFNAFPEPSRRTRLETYLWDSADEESVAIAEAFYEPNEPIKPFGVLIPVAAHQEAGRVAKALACYATQKDAQPFTIFLLLNYPKSAAESAVVECNQELALARQANPNLDIRVAMNKYADKTPIGQIRKDLWDAVMRLSIVDGIYYGRGREFIGLNHDIDTESMIPHYMRNVQKHFQKLQNNLTEEDLHEWPLPTLFTQVRHSYPFETHPNISRAVLWSDLAARQAYPYGVMEEGIAIPMSRYAVNGGFDSKAQLSETKWLWPVLATAGIPGTGMNTSPRRYIARLGQHGTKGIWTEESFTTTDECRAIGFEQTDISHVDLEDIIVQNFDEDLFHFLKKDIELWKTLGDKLAYRDPADEVYVEFREKAQIMVRERIEFRLKFARRVLERVILSPMLASLVDDTVVDRYTQRVMTDIEEDVKERTNDVRFMLKS